MPRIGHQQDHASDAKVSLLDAHPPFERLKIVQSGFGLDQRVDGRAVDDYVGAP